jgi:chromosome segregation ATPase
MSVSKEKYDNLKEKAYEWYEQLNEYKNELKNIKKEIKKLEKLSALQEKSYQKQIQQIHQDHERDLEKLKNTFEKDEHKLQEKYERQIIEKNQDIRILEKDVENYKERLTELKEEYRQRPKN